MRLKISRFLIAAILGSVGLFSLAGQAAAYTPKTGDLVRPAGYKTVFLVDDNLQRIPIDQTAISLRYGPAKPVIKTVTVSELSNYTTYQFINTQSSHADGTYIMYGLNDTDPVYVLDHGFKRPFTSRADFLANGHTLGQVAWVGTFEVYPTGDVAQ